METKKKILYKDWYCTIEITPSNICIYTDTMRSFIVMSLEVGKYIANRMKSDMKFAYKCLDRLEGRF